MVYDSLVAVLSFKFWKLFSHQTKLLLFLKKKKKKNYLFHFISVVFHPVNVTCANFRYVMTNANSQIRDATKTGPKKTTKYTSL